MSIYARIDMSKQKAAEAELNRFAEAVRNDTLGDFSVTGAWVSVLMAMDYEMMED